MGSHDEDVQQQFDPQARAYLASAVHAQGPDLTMARALVEAAGLRQGRALDVGCGAGHLSFTLAPDVAGIVALDPAPRMLAVVGEAAAARGLSGVEVRQAGAEDLPFPAASFDLVGTRYSAHHWRDLERALREMHRVLKPGGRLMMIDVVGDEIALVDTHLQAIELLRDRSHVRNRSASEWQALLVAAGFVLVEQHAWPLRLEFASWVERMRTPPDRVAMLRSLQADAPAEVQQALAIEPDGSFSARTALFWARA